MAINDLSGNFQPLTTVSGRPLPQPEVRNNAAPENSPDSGRVSNAESVANFQNVLINEQQNEPNNEVTSEDIRAQIEELNQISQNVQRRLSFQIDDELGETIVRVIDRETDELIRQIPSDEILTLSRRLKELNAGPPDISSGILIQREV